MTTDVRCVKSYAFRPTFAARHSEVDVGANAGYCSLLGTIVTVYTGTIANEQPSCAAIVRVKRREA
jgi:hypothetical protein